MPGLYDVNCPTCGVNEVIALLADVRKSGGVLRCGVCGTPSPQHFGPRHGQHIRIDAGGEDSNDPARVADGTSKFNVGLKGIDTVVGERADGKPRLAYRPRTNAELGSNRGVREEAARQGLTPAEGGRYRSVGR